MKVTAVIKEIIPDPEEKKETVNGTETLQKSESKPETKGILTEEHIITTGHKSIYGNIYMPKKKGKYPAVILSHGYNSANSDLIKECTYFAEHGYVAYAFDFCGGSTRSKSSGATTYMTLFTEKEDLLTVFENAASLEYVNSEKIYLFGASQGGMVSALAAEDLAGKTAGLILYFPAFCIPDDWRSKYPSTDNIPETINFWDMNLGRNFVTSIHDFYVFDSIGKYSGDVLIIYGEKDPIVPVEYMIQAKDTYENVELIIIENEGHGFSPAGSRYAMKKALEFMKTHTTAK